ncbi:MAG: hypothetical protein MI924_09905 [Chloroflexales bacterium]|nr:hypothetical protein [Chloroflexales bacterium]
MAPRILRAASAGYLVQGVVGVAGRPVAEPVAGCVVAVLKAVGRCALSSAPVSRFSPS